MRHVKKNPFIPLIDWIAGILHAEPMTPRQVANLFGRTTLASSIDRLRTAKRVRIIGYVRHVKTGLPMPLYGEPNGLPDARPYLYGAQEVKRRYDRKHRRLPKVPRPPPRTTSENCRNYRTRQKLKVASVFDWRGPLKPYEPRAV